MGLTDEDKQRVKTAFLSYAQGQPQVAPAMIDQFICGAIPNLSFEQLQAKKTVKKVGGDGGYDRAAFFALVNSSPEYIVFIRQHFQPAPPTPKAAQVDGVDVMVAKGF